MEQRDLFNFAIIFLSQKILLRWLPILRKSLTVTLTALPFWVCFFLVMLVFVLQWLLIRQEIVIMFLSQFPLSSYQTPKALFHRIAYDYSLAYWDGLCDHLRNVPWEDIFKLVLLVLLVNSLSGFRLELMLMSFVISISSSLTRLHDFQLLC